MDNSFFANELDSVKKKIEECENGMFPVIYDTQEKKYEYLKELKSEKEILLQHLVEIEKQKEEFSRKKQIREIENQKIDKETQKIDKINQKIKLTIELEKIKNGQPFAKRAKRETRSPSSITPLYMSKSGKEAFEELKKLYGIDIKSFSKDDRKDEDNKKYFEMWDIIKTARPREKPLQTCQSVKPISHGKENQEVKDRLDELRKVGLGGIRSYCIVSEEDLKSKKFKLKVPLEDIDNTKDLLGRTDAVMLQTGRDLQISSINLIFEFKSCSAVFLPKSFYQAIFELIGFALESDIPVLSVLTDMENFFLIRIHPGRTVEGKIQIVSYQAKYEEAMELIDGWLNIYTLLDSYEPSIKSTTSYIELRKNYDMIVENMKQLRQRKEAIISLPYVQEEYNFKPSLSRNQVEEAFEKDWKQVISNIGKCRTGKVIKISVNGNPYALKIPIERSNKVKMETVIGELRNEFEVYQRLELLQKRKGIDDKDLVRRPWPTLVYAGPLKNFDKYTLKSPYEIKEFEFVIVTNFIAGRKPETKNNCPPNDWNYIKEFDKNACKRALHTLNGYGIVHRDPRVQNFLIVSQKNQTNLAFILDFAFSSPYCLRQEHEPLLSYQHSVRNGSLHSASEFKELEDNSNEFEWSGEDSQESEYSGSNKYDNGMD